VRAHPQVTIFLRGRVKSYAAREVHGTERMELWQKAANYYIGFTLYEQWTTRQIPVIVLEP
jgi:deazaflavin-dependent oxidoreductase (nitroreductase family)